MNHKILIIGGSGLIGDYLASRFKSEGNFVGIIVRNIIKRDYDEHIEADTTNEGKWTEKIKEYEIIINLAGANIGKRWSKKYKEEILESRVKTTENISKIISKDQILFNASAVGYYGNCGDKILTEDDPPKDDFLSIVCQKWEEAALKSRDNGARVYIMRFGVVASKNGGAFAKLIRNHKLMLGAVIGKGNQYISPIHIEDIFLAIKFLIIKLPDKSTYNFTIPNPITNMELTYKIAETIRRPLIIPFIPSFILRLILGEFADTLLFSQRAIPKRLAELGFEFKFDTINKILQNLISDNRHMKKSTKY